MGALIGIVAIVAYYLIISKFIDAGSAPALFVGMAYVLIPLIGIPMIVGGVRLSIKPSSRGQHIKAIVSVAGIVAVTIVGLALADQWFTPNSPDPAAVEQSKRAAWIVRGQESVKAKLKDPGSAEFRGIYFSKGKDGLPVTCGEVNSKNSFGGYSGHQKFVSAGSPELTYLQEQMAASEFAKVWAALCAK